MRILVTGGCGYVGSVLVPKLLAAGHHVRVMDIQWFGDYLAPHPRLKVIQGDIRDEFPIGAAHTVIHLAGVALDAMGELDPKLTWEINALATAQLAARAVKEGVEQFIYASSGSVYGVSDAPQVTEDAPLVPLSEYNKTKMVAERVLLSYANRMSVQIVRPATVCGFSPRMRLDVMVNSLTMQALQRNAIAYNGGEQYRPNIHIEDMTDLYLWLLERPGLTGIWNAGFENLRICEIGKLIAERTGAPLISAPSNDPRSYRLDSGKLLAAGFQPKKTVANAIDELIVKYRAGELKDEPQWHSLKSMKAA